MANCYYVLLMLVFLQDLTLDPQLLDP
jgi:hypothetical protein